jgi:hypothetical protein
MLVTCDLDSTLCDTGHRQHTLSPEKGVNDYKAYSMLCADDEPIEAMRRILYGMSFHPGFELWYVSGRDEAARELTTKWLEGNSPVRWAGLLLDDQQFQTEGHDKYKLRRIKEVQRLTGQRVDLHIDDWAAVAVLLEANGIPCLCVRTPQEVLSLTEGLAV